jgi:hypothetical protein
LRETTDPTGCGSLFLVVILTFVDEGRTACDGSTEKELIPKRGCKTSRRESVFMVRVESMDPGGL